MCCTMVLNIGIVIIIATVIVYRKMSGVASSKVNTRLPRKISGALYEFRQMKLLYEIMHIE